MGGAVEQGANMLSIGKRWCRLVLLSMVACLCGCIEVEQRLRVHDDGSVSLNGVMKIDPQYEAVVLPKLKVELTKKAPPGVRLDFSQRIDGKAAILFEADAAAATAMMKEEGSATITVSDGGLMKKRYEYREVVQRVPEIPFPNRMTLSLPGSIESVTGGKKIADDTVEFDQTHAKRGDVFGATSTAFAFSLGRASNIASGAANPRQAAWLMPVSVGSICAGVALLLTGWIRSRQAATRPVGAPAAIATPRPVSRVPTPVEEVASVFCIECGVPNAVGRKFCGKCGHALG
jgi:hypothetical protein